MKFRYTLMCLTVSAVFSSPSMAIDYVWHTSIIKQLTMLNDGSFKIVLVDDSAQCTPLSGEDVFTVAVDESGVGETGRKHMLSTVLLAASQGTKVSIAFDSASPSCYVNRLQMRYI